MAHITIKNVTRAFEDGFVILENFSQTIGDKEFVTLLGPSGCGKTTMLRMLAGFDKPTSGEIYIDDVLMSGGKTFVPPEKRGIGMVFQSYAVWPHMTVFDNVGYPLKIAGKPRSFIKEKVDWILNAVHLSQYAERIPSQLSGGQQQRVALGRALVCEPKVLLLDEPLSNLDAKLRESMRFEIKDIQQSFGITVVYVTHDQTEAMAMSDRVIVIKDGVIQQAAGPREIYRRPVNRFVCDFVGKVNFMKGSAAGGKITFALSGQTVDYDGPLSGPVIFAIRPENIRVTSHPGGADPGESGKINSLTGKIAGMYYLGDINDLRVDVGGTVIRVIADSRSYDTLKAGETVSLNLHEFLVYPDDGEDTTRIVT